MSTLTARELAEAAAAVVMERGKTEDIRCDDTGRVCLLGALDVALYRRYDVEFTRDSPMFNGRWLHGFCPPAVGSADRAWSDNDLLTDDEYAAYRDVYFTLRQILGERGYEHGHHGHPPVKWNNQPEITAEDVALLFKEAATRLP